MFLKDFLPDYAMPPAAAAFILGVAAGGLAALPVHPAMAAVAEGTAAIALAGMTVRLGIQRQADLAMSHDGIKKLSLRLSRYFLLLCFCLGLLRECGALWPKEGLTLRDGYPVHGAGVIEEMKALPASDYTGPRYQITVKLRGGGEAADEAGLSGEKDSLLWKRQRKILLTICFSRGKAGEAEGAAFGQHYLPGARISFDAVIREGARPRNPGEFDYTQYLGTKGIYCRGEAEREQILLARQPPAYQRFLSDLRNRFRRQLALYLDPKSGALISGCFLGDQSLMEREDKDLYRQAGIAHLFSVSGTHGGILLAAALHLERIRLFQKRKWISRLFALCLLFFYLSLTGFPMSMQRTLIMACITQGAILLRRKNNTLDALATAAVFLLWFSPQSLFGAGFQLSFGVTWGLVHLGPWLRKRLPPLLALPVAAQLAAMPMQAFWFYQIQPAGFILNLWAVSLMPPLLLLSSLAALAGFAGAGASAFLWQAPGFLATLLDRAAALWAALPIASVNIAVKPWPAYALCGLILWLLPGMKVKEEAISQWLYQRDSQKKKREEWRQWQGWRLSKKRLQEGGRDEAARREDACKGAGPRENPSPADMEDIPSAFTPQRIKHGLPLVAWERRKPAAAILVMLCFAISLLAPKPLRITFLDVGQGDGIVFVTPSGKVWMVDGGSSNVSRLAYYRLEPFLRSQGINRLDYILVSHTDGDHISGLAGLLSSGWPVGYFILAPQAGDSEDGRALIALAEENGAKAVFLSAGQTIRDGGAFLTCLYPGKEKEPASANDGSLVVQLRYKHFSLLLTGDIGMQTEEELMGGWPESSLLKVAHHGSGNGSGTAFLQEVKPKAAVISCSENNVYGHPHPDVLKRLKEAGCFVYLTMEKGAVQVTTKGGAFRIGSYIHPNKDSTWGTMAEGWKTRAR